MTTPQPLPIKTLIVDLSKQYGGSTSRVLALMQRLPKGTVALAGLESSAITQHALRNRATNSGIFVWGIPKFPGFLTENRVQPSPIGAVE